MTTTSVSRGSGPRVDSADGHGSLRNEQPQILYGLVGDCTERHRPDGRAGRRVRDVGERASVPHGDQRGRLPRAVAALTETHAGTREPLDDVEVVAPCDRALELGPRHLLAAADDRVRGGELVDARTDPVHSPQRALEPTLGEQAAADRLRMRV